MRTLCYHIYKSPALQCCVIPRLKLQIIFSAAEFDANNAFHENSNMGVQALQH